MSTRLPVAIEDEIKTPVRSNGWELYLFDLKRQKPWPYPAQQLFYNDSYTIFTPVENYVGELAIARRMQYPQMTLHEGQVFAWRKRKIRNGYVQTNFAAVVNLPVKYKVIILYFIPRNKSVEVHTPVDALHDENLGLDGFLLPYDDFIKSVANINSATV